MKIFRASSCLSLVAAECNWQQHQKPKRCKDIEFTMEKTNSWVCRDCFNYRVNFRTDQLQIDWWWTNEDFIYLTFDEPVSFVTAAYPVKDAVLYSTGADGQQTYKLTFESHFNPGDKRIDFNIQFREDNLTSVVSAATICPFCHPVPSFVVNVAPQALVAQVDNWCDIEIIVDKKYHINHQQFTNKMNRVKKYLTWTDNILVDATYDCAKPYNTDKFLSDSYTQWQIENNSEIEALRLDDSVAATCQLIDLMEDGVRALAESYVCLDEMPRGKQIRFGGKIDKISNSKGPQCVALKSTP